MGRANHVVITAIGQDTDTLLGTQVVPHEVIIIKKKGKGHFYLTSVVPSVPTRLLSMEADGAPSTPPATVSAPFYGHSKL